MTEVGGPCHQYGPGGIRELASVGNFGSEAILELGNMDEPYATGSDIRVTGLVDIW